MRRLIGVLVGLAFLVAACATDPPWMNPDGFIANGALVLEYNGFNRCDMRSVTFLQFHGKQYATDFKGDLGVLTAEDGTGRVLTFEFLEEIPSGAQPTGYIRGQREIYLDENVREDYLYILNGSVMERWPRAEIYCETQRPAGG